MCETAPAVVPADQWTHVAVVGDGTYFSIYVNGVLSQESAFQRTDGTNATYYIGGDPRYPNESLAGIVDDVRVWDHAMSQDDVRSAMETQDGVILKAYWPDPVDGAIHPDTWASLYWTPGSTADTHDVYFGENYPPAFQRNQTETTFKPGLLEYGGKYYWRVDEVGPYGTTAGAVWSFTATTGRGGR